MATETPEQDRVAAFADEYAALCQRHGLQITFDSGYVAREVSVLREQIDESEFYAGEGPWV